MHVDVFMYEKLELWVIRRDILLVYANGLAQLWRTPRDPPTTSSVTQS